MLTDIIYDALEEILYVHFVIIKDWIVIDTISNKPNDYYIDEWTSMEEHIISLKESYESKYWITWIQILQSKKYSEKDIESRRETVKRLLK